MDLLTHEYTGHALMLQSYNLKNIINAPTQISDNCSSLSDYIICGIDMSIFTGVYDSSIADHCNFFIYA